MTAAEYEPTAAEVARLDAYVRFNRAAGDATDAKHKHGLGSAQHLAAVAVVDERRTAFVVAVDALRISKAVAA